MMLNQLMLSSYILILILIRFFANVKKKQKISANISNQSTLKRIEIRTRFRTKQRFV